MLFPRGNTYSDGWRRLGGGGLGRGRDGRGAWRGGGRLALLGGRGRAGGALGGGGVHAGRVTKSSMGGVSYGKLKPTRKFLNFCTRCSEGVSAHAGYAREARVKGRYV